MCDIDRAITKYTFFGNGGANLHTKYFETRAVTLKIVFFDPLRVHGNPIFRLDYNYFKRHIDVAQVNPAL